MVTLKNPHNCIIQPFSYMHAKNEAGCSSDSRDIECQRGNLSTWVTSKIALSQTAQL